MAIAFVGLGVSKGIVIGPASPLRYGQPEVPHYILPSHTIDDEVARFQTALTTARQQLQAIKARIPAQAPSEIAQFIETHLLMLEDEALSNTPATLIREQQCNAEWALQQQEEALLRVFDDMADAYLKTRRDDVVHAVKRIQQILLSGGLGHELATQESHHSRVVLASDLSPAELVLLHHQGVAAIVTERGGPLSHLAILARSLDLPAVVGIHDIEYRVQENETLVVDGDRGVVLCELEESALAYYRQRRRQEIDTQAVYVHTRQQACVTLDGIRIKLLANIEQPQDTGQLEGLNHNGIGLYRTEFLFMNRESLPDEEEQYQAYLQVVEAMQGKPVTIRSLDLGADKAMAGDTHTDASASNALGLRAIRLCLKENDLFKPQLRAILRASAHGPVKLLIPMLSTMNEVQQVLGMIRSIKAELHGEGHDFDGQMPVGAMIEVPAAAVCADCFANALDFLSIGTNDLIQYTLAADRIDDSVNHLYDPLHPAVLRLIANTITAGQQLATPVSLCGEMAADSRYTRLLLGMGLCEFSMPANRLLEIKHVINNSELEKLQPLTRKLLAAQHQEEAIRLFEAINTCD